MIEPTQKTGIDLRRDPRKDLSNTVTIRFEVESIVGPGQNISAQGVFFTATAIPVTVRIDGRDEVVLGELRRVEAMGDGQFGIAVRFAEPQPALMA